MFSAINIPSSGDPMAAAAVANHSISTSSLPSSSSPLLHDTASASAEEQQLLSTSAAAAAAASGGKNPSNLMTRAVVANDTDVSNGFVKDGKTLPYVFEANDAGVRKRSSKILPICAICNRKFVCVTTMKRHLVTHTGQKPFSCRECGKQYTQKGNLRVHERTHRNDRPFECNICRQKFFRKEPMQKHQWRQHGIVHAKLPESLPPSAKPPLEGLVAPSSSAAAHFREDVEEQLQFEEQQLQPEQLPQPPVTYQVVEPATAISIQEKNDSDDVAPEDFSATRRPSADGPAPPRAHSQESRSTIRFQFSKLSEKYAPDPALSAAVVAAPPKAHSSSYTSHVLSQRSSEDRALDNAEVVNLSSEAITNAAPPPPPPTGSHGPLKLKMKMAYKMMECRSQEEEREEGGARELGAGTSLNPDQMKAAQQQEQGSSDLETNCKSCGQLFAVVDPYNVVCGHCGYNYNHPTAAAPLPPTAAPSHPLQCPGCLAVFPHKPALKSHQTTGGDKDRPFKCCVCSYHFRQKAHLQKHQWRIHRKRPEPEDIGGVDLKVTIQDIINHCVEPSITRGDDEPSSKKAPLDLSPAKTAASPTSCRTKTGRLHNIVHNIVSAEEHHLDEDDSRDMVIDETVKSDQQQQQPQPVTKKLRPDGGSSSSSSSHVNLPSISGLIHKPAGQMFGARLPSEVISGLLATPTDKLRTSQLIASGSAGHDDKASACPNVRTV